MPLENHRRQLDAFDVAGFDAPAVRFARFSLDDTLDRRANRLVRRHAAQNLAFGGRERFRFRNDADGRKPAFRASGSDHLEHAAAMGTGPPAARGFRSSVRDVPKRKPEKTR